MILGSFSIKKKIVSADEDDKSFYTFGGNADKYSYFMKPSVISSKN
jgi:hypothetical protein